MIKGSKASEECKQKMRESALKRGIRPPSRLGIPNTPEQKAKIRATLRAIGHKPPVQYGEDNPSKRPDVRAKISLANSGTRNPGWKGDQVGYSALHTWVRRTLGTPSKCEKCNIDDIAKKYEWANISGQYKRDINDWMRLCRQCHSEYDDIPQKAWATRRKKALNGKHRSDA